MGLVRRRCILHSISPIYSCEQVWVSEAAPDKDREKRVDLVLEGGGVKGIGLVGASESKAVRGLCEKQRAETRAL